MPRHLSLLLLAPALACAADFDFEGPPHNYWQRPLTDRFTKLKAEVEAGHVKLDTTGEKAFVLSLLAALEIPPTSQMLVFSTTSLQLRFISPRNPRALFFNENVYVGYIPGARIEVLSLDPALGGIFYIFDIPRNGATPKLDRSERCMNCHAHEDTLFVPGLTAKSVVPGLAGGSLTGFRAQQTGDSIPLKDRFGGWYLTGAENISEHWGNAVGKFVDGKVQRIPIEPGQYFSYDHYPVATSDVLPQLLHEHQIGFANRVIEATYHTRAYLASDNGQLTPEHRQELDDKAHALVRYLLFADETALPADGIPGDPAYKADFARTRRPGPEGASLKDLDLKSHLFRYRCSYMIYSDVFSGLPAEMRQRVDQRLAQALSETKPDPEFAYLPAGEKRSIRGILKATLPNPPAGL